MIEKYKDTYVKKEVKNEGKTIIRQRYRLTDLIEVLIRKGLIDAGDLDNGAI